LIETAVPPWLRRCPRPRSLKATFAVLTYGVPP
jgi:hypothetical protein